MQYILCLLLLLTLPLSAQESVSEVRRQVFGNPFNQGNETLINLLNFIEKESAVDQMLFQTWQPLEILVTDSTLLIVDSANYHIAQDRIYFIYQGRLFQLHVQHVRHATLSGRKFIHIHDPLGVLRSSAHYFEVMVEGEYTLLCRHALKTEVVNDHPMGLPSTRRTEHRRLEKFFFLRQESTRPQSVPTKKHDFIMIFRKHRPQMAIFAKEQRISLRKAEDLRSIFTYYNQLAGS